MGERCNVAIQAELVDVWCSDRGPTRELAEAAWVSTYDVGKGVQKSPEDAARVVRMLVESDPPHTSPLENVWLKYWVTCPIFVERQYDKYRMSQQLQGLDMVWDLYAAPFGRWGIAQNEQSGRYRTLPAQWYELPRDVKDILGKTLGGRELMCQYVDLSQQQHKFYKYVLKIMPAEWKKRGHKRNRDYKRVREVFRGILGTNTMTQMRIVLNLNALGHVLSQRLHVDSQWEAQVLGARMLEAALGVGAIPEEMLGEKGMGAGWLTELARVTEQEGEGMGRK